MKTNVTLVAAPVLCWAASTAATSGQYMPSYARRSMSGSDCTKPKDGRFPDQHLFAKSKRLSDFIVEGENECRQPLSSCSWPVPSIMRVYTRMIETSTPDS